MTSTHNLGLQITINGLIELHRRIARGFRNRDDYRLRMLLIGGGLDKISDPTAGMKSRICPLDPAASNTPYRRDPLVFLNIGVPFRRAG